MRTTGSTGQPPLSWACAAIAASRASTTTVALSATLVLSASTIRAPPPVLARQIAERRQAEARSSLRSPQSTPATCDRMTGRRCSAR